MKYQCKFLTPTFLNKPEPTKFIQAFPALAGQAVAIFIRMKEMLLLFSVFMLLSTFSHGQNELAVPDQFRSLPDPFDKSRISRYLSNDDLNPTDYEGFYNRGVRNLQNGLYREAIDDFRSVLIPVSDLVGTQQASPDPYFLIGVCHNMLNAPDSALHYFNITLSIDPAYADAYSERGLVYLTGGNVMSAIVDFKDALRLDPASVYAQYNLGYSYFLQGEMKQAAKTLKKVAKAAPGYEWPQILLGAIAMQHNKLKRAEKHFNKALEINREQPVAYYNRGLLRVRKAIASYSDFQLRIAYGDFTRTTELDPADAKAYDMLAFIDVLERRPGSALENLYRAATARFSDSAYRPTASPYRVEEYYLLQEIYNNNISQKEKSIARDYFIDDLTLRLEASPSKIQTELFKNPSSEFLKRMLVYHFLKVQNLEDVATFLDEIIAGDTAPMHLQCVRAELYQMNDQIEQGLRLIRTLLAADSSYAFGYYVAGKLHYDNENYPEALAMLDKAIAIHPDFRNSYYARSKVYAAIESYQNQLNDAFMLIYLNPDLVHGYYQSGYAYNRLQKPDSAMIMLNAAKYLDATSPNLYKEMAYSYMLLGDYKKMDNVFGKLRNVYGKGYDHYYRGLFYKSEIQDTSIAVKNLRQACEDDPGNKFFLATMGDFNFHERENYREATQYYKRSNKIDPDYMYALSMTGRSYAELNEQISAIDYYEKVLDIDTANVNAMIYIGRSYIKLDNHRRAKEFFSRALAIDSLNASVNGNIGWGYYLMDDFDSCISYSQKAIELKPASYYAMANIALSTLCLGNYEASRKLYHDYWETVKNMDQSVYDGAIKDLEDLIEKGKHEKEARNMLKDYFGVE